jgi:hypothetical protein
MKRKDCAKNCVLESDCEGCRSFVTLSSDAVLGDGWRDVLKELPADGEQVIWVVLWKGGCDQGLETPDEYEYIYGRYYEEMEVVRLPWSDKEYKVKWMNYWRRIDPPAFA